MYLIADIQNTQSKNQHKEIEKKRIEKWKKQKEIEKGEIDECSWKFQHPSFTNGYESSQKINRDIEETIN